MSNEQLELAPAQPNTDPLAIIASAAQNNLDVDTLRAMLEMRRELKAEQAREQFLAALSAFQSEVPRIEKTKQVKDKQGRPRYSYAPLDSIIEQVKPYLKKHGFSYTMKPVQEEAGSFTARLQIHHASGHQEETSFTVPIDPEAYMNAPQKVGSARTFAMRYAFCNAFGILTADQDDDANIDAGSVVAHTATIQSLTEADSLETLQARFKEAYLRLKGEGDANGVKVITTAYDQRKKELMNG